MGLINNIATKAAKVWNGALPARWASQFRIGSDIVSWSEINDKAYVYEGYQKNPTVYSVISMVGKAAGPIPWNVYKKNSDGTKEPVTNVLLEELLRQPNPMNSWSQFVQEAIGFKLLHGNTFVWGIEGGTSLTRGTFNSLWNLPSQYVRIITTGNQKAIKGYSLDFYGSNEVIPTKYVMHIKDWNPDYRNNGEFLMGQSPLRAVFRSLDIANQAITTSKSYLEHQGPRGILSTKNGSNVKFSKEQAKELQKDWDSNHTGSSKSGNTIVTPNEFKWIPMGLSPADMKLMDQYNLSQQDICNAFNFPSLLIGLKSGTYANQNEAKKALYNNVVIPLLSELRDGLNTWLTPRYGDGICLDFDISGIRELQEDFQAQAMAVKGLAGIFTINEIRAKLGAAPRPDGDEYLPLPNQQILDNGTDIGDKDKQDGSKTSE